MGRRRTLTQPAPAAGGTRPVTTYTYDDVSQLRQTVDPNGVVSKQDFDVLGRKRVSSVIESKKANAEYNKTQFDYDDANNLVRVRNALDKDITMSYNTGGQKVTETDEIGVSTQYTYDQPMGWLRSATAGGIRRVRYTYDTAGRKTMVEGVVPTGDPLAAAAITSESWTFDANGNVKSHVRPTSTGTATDTSDYDALDRLTVSKTQLTAPASPAQPTYSQTSVGYDASGNAVRVVDPNLYVTTMGYNAWGTLESTTEPSTTAFPALANRQWTVRYNAGGLPVSEVRPGAVTVTRAYDLLGRMTSEQGAGTGVVTASKSFGYDAGSRLTAVGTGATAQTFAYFDSGGLASSSGPAGVSSFDINADGTRSSRTDAAGTSTFTYTDRRELKSYTVGGQKVDLTWNAVGQVGKMTYPGATTRDFSYDDVGRLTDDHVRSSGLVSLQRRQYTYNADSSVGSSTVTAPGNAAAGTYTYGYDAGGRLTSYTKTGTAAVSYGYDTAGNRTSVAGQPYVFDQRNRLVSGGGSTFSWSARGSLTSVTGTGAASYTFDGLDRLTSAVGVAYTYDGLDRVLTRGADAFKYGGLESDPVADSSSVSYQRSPSGSLLGVTRASVLS